MPLPMRNGEQSVRDPAPKDCPDFRSHRRRAAHENRFEPPANARMSASLTMRRALEKLSTSSCRRILDHNGGEIPFQGTDQTWAESPPST